MKATCADTISLDRLVQSLPGNLLVVRPDAPCFTIATLNDNLAALFNVNKKDICGEGILEIIANRRIILHPANLKPISESLLYVTEKKVTHEVSAADGPLVFHHAPVLDDKGDIDYIIISITINNDRVSSVDVSGTITAEALMQAPIGIGLLTGPQFEIGFLNQVLKRMWNMANTDCSGKRVPDIFPGFAIQGFHELLNNIRKSGERYHAREQYAEHIVNGGVRHAYYDIIYQPMQCANDEADIMIFAKDVTDHVIRRKKVEESETRLQLAIESCNIGIWEMDLIHHRHYHSITHDRIFGYEKPISDWTIERFFMHVHEDDKLFAEERIKEALQHGILNMEIKLLKASGENANVNIYGKVFYNEEKEPQKMIGIITDITKQKQLQDILHNNTEQLEKRVEERTSDLLEANTSLQHVNRKLEEFVYAASHDLQEPLRKLMTYTGIIAIQEKERLTEPGRLTVGNIVKAVERMQLLIKDLSDLSRTSRTDEEFTDVDLDNVLIEVLNEQLQEFGGRGVEIRSDRLPVFRAIREQMYQLLENLVSNALKFSAHATPPVISIRCRHINTTSTPPKGFAPGSTYLELVVEDNGIGFDQQYEKKIFQLFQRLHNKNNYPGTGIGLSICRNIAENHNGFISATGMPGQGARFTVYLKSC